MKKISQIFIKISLVLIASLFLFNCSNESIDDNVIMNPLDSQSNNLKTVPLENSLNFLKKLNSDRLTNRGLISNDIGLKIDIESLEQVDITNTDAKLNIASATTKFEGVETEFLQIEINGELQTILFHHVPEKKITMNSRVPIDDKNYTGDVYSTDLYGRVLSGFSINKGTISGSYNPSPYATDPVKLNEVIIKNTYTAPPYGGNYYTMMNYGFVRPQSMSNYASMGLAYASYYRYLQIKKFDDGIKDALLKPCLKKILDNLKKNGTSPGNMVMTFTNDWNSTNYNWTVKSGTLDGFTAGNTSSNYNITTGITTIFDSQGFPDATDLSWAKTILHESVHAYLVTYFKTNRPGWVATYPEMIKDWAAKPDLNAVHHEEIARSLVKSIGTALEVYGVSQGYNLTKQFYEDMAWGGLQETNAFKALPKSDQNRILDTLSAELTGMDINGDYKSQKGKKAGC
jgi:hypothetical protein